MERIWSPGWRPAARRGCFGGEADDLHGRGLHLGDEAELVGSEIVGAAFVIRRRFVSRCAGRCGDRRRGRSG